MPFPSVLSIFHGISRIKIKKCEMIFLVQQRLVLMLTMNVDQQACHIF